MKPIFHRLIFWGHLIAGLVAGVVILSMAVTGLIISYEAQLIDWANRDLRVTPPVAGAPHLDIEPLLAKVHETKPDLNPNGITWKADPAMPVTLSQVLHETKTGASILFHDKPLFAMIGLYALLSVLYMPVETIVLARHFKDLDDPRTLGFILSAMSIGIVIGALQLHRALKLLSPAGLVVWSMTIIGASVCAMALLPGALWFMGIGFVLGLAFGPVSPLGNYLVQQRVPERNHGPVFGVQLSLYHVATPAGSLALGLIIESVSIPWTLILIGVTFIVVTFGLGLFGPIRRL